MTHRTCFSRPATYQRLTGSRGGQPRRSEEQSRTPSSRSLSIERLRVTPRRLEMATELLSCTAAQHVERREGGRCLVRLSRKADFRSAYRRRRETHERYRMAQSHNKVLMMREEAVAPRGECLHRSGASLHLLAVQDSDEVVSGLRAKPTPGAIGSDGPPRRTSPMRCSLDSHWHSK